MLSNICTRNAEPVSPVSTEKQSSKTPALPNRERRFPTEAQGPSRSGSAGQVMVWAVKRI